MCGGSESSEGRGYPLSGEESEYMPRVYGCLWPCNTNNCAVRAEGAEDGDRREPPRRTRRPQAGA
jgi:hypothetical protein